MEQNYMEILLEEMRGKFDLVLEGHAALHAELRETRREWNEKHDLINFTLQTMSGQIKGLDGRVGSLEGRMGSLEGTVETLESKVERLDSKVERLEGKVDAIAANLSAHRADTEAHCGYGVRE